MSRLVPARLLEALRLDATQAVETTGDLAVETRNRIRIAAMLATAGYAVFLATELGRGKPPLERSIDVTHDVLGLLLCGLLFLISASRSIGDRALLTAAWIVEVLVVALTSTAVPWAAYLRTGHVSSLTWAVPIIITFALLIPESPRATIRVSALCGLLMILGPGVLAARGVIHLSAWDLLHSIATAAVAVGIAAVASHTVYGARQQIAAARRVGSYELVERLGQGGMGEVWKARHLLLARPAAVKLILAEALQGPAEERDAAVRRFTREAQVTASLRSPHTVELFDFGSGVNQTLYYAMEMLDGLNLEHFVYRFGPVEPRRAVHWLRQACHSLGEAHSRRLVHRDIKPGNIMLCRFGRDVDFIKVLDFGLTKAPAAPADMAVTTRGAMMGTPGYMAPEQVFGLEAEPRTDLYALGCVGYFLLAGERPFEGESAGEVMRQHVQSPPPPLSGRAAGEIPPRLEALILACLAKDPDRRPADADRLDAALAEAVDGEPWTEAEARAWWERNLPAASYENASG